MMFVPNVRSPIALKILPALLLVSRAPGAPDTL